MMDIQVSTKAERIAGVPRRWAEQYQDDRHGADKHTITRRLAELQPGFTEKEVTEIIGNGSWTAHRCDVTGKDSDVLAVLGEGESWLAVSEEGLKAALKAIRAAKVVQS